MPPKTFANAVSNLNVNLLDQLDLLERLEVADHDGGYEKIKQQLAFKSVNPVVS